MGLLLRGQSKVKVGYGGPHLTLIVASFVAPVDRGVLPRRQSIHAIRFQRAVP
jgi:hypothetical protein